MFYTLFLYFLIYILLLTKTNGNDLKLSIDFDKTNMEFYNYGSFSYDSYGQLRLHGRWENNEARFANLFLKEITASKCQKERTEIGIHFDIVFCVSGCDETNKDDYPDEDYKPDQDDAPDEGDTKCKECSKGMKLCYQSELSAGKVKNPKHEMKVNQKIDCKDENLHGLQVNAVNNLTSGKIDFTLISSIDAETYKFSINRSEDCFKIRVGDAADLSTKITDLYDNKLNVNPPLKEIDEGRKWLDDGWAESKQNFHLFALDFIPAKKKNELNVGDYYKTLSYFGGGYQCNMYMKFAGEDFVHKCKMVWMPVEIRSPGCNIARKKRNSKIKKTALFNATNNVKYKSATNRLVCGFKTEQTNIKNQTIIDRDESSSGKWNNAESYLDYYNMHLGGKIKGIPIEFLDMEFYTNKQIETYKENHSKEKIIQSSKFEALTISKEYKFEIEQGQKISVKQLQLICNGWIISFPHVINVLEKS